MKKILVNGAGGVIGGHLVKRLKAEGLWVWAVDLKAILGKLKHPTLLDKLCPSSR